MSDSFYLLWAYNDWANKSLLRKMKLHQNAITPSIIRLFSHITNAQEIWLCRINGEIPPVGPWDEHGLSECEKAHILSSKALQQKLEDCKLNPLKTVCYTNTKNERFENSMQDILLHIFNHGTYHRAQIAAEMRKIGLEPLNTDYITFARTFNKNLKNGRSISKSKQ